MNGKVLKNKIKATNVLFILPIAAMAFLAFYQLGNRELWYDEAHNVALAQNVVRYGYPRVWDGKNLISFYHGSDFYYGFTEMFLNWLPYYLAAFGMLFSKSLFAVRFIFVVMGLGSAVYLYMFTEKITRNKGIALIALWMYCLSSPVIVYIKTAYYYSPSLLFVMMTAYYFACIYHEKKRSSYILFSISMILLYYTNYLFFGILLIVYILCVFIYRVKNFLNKSAIISIIVILAVAGPFQLLKMYYYTKFGVLYPKQGLYEFLLQFPAQFWQLQVYFFPLISLGLFGLIRRLTIAFLGKKAGTEHKDGLVIKHRKQKPFVFLMLVAILFNCAFISYFTYDYATRYLILSIPFSFVLGAMMLHRFFHRDRILLFLILLSLIVTDYIHKAPYYLVKLSGTERHPLVTTFVKPACPYYYVAWHGVSYTLEEYMEKFLPQESGFLRYLKALPKDYDNSDEGLIKFLARYSEEGDTVLVLSSNHYQNIYYLDVISYELREAPDHILMEKDRYTDKYSFYKYNRNLEYFNRVYKPIEYSDWVTINRDDLEKNYTGLQPIFDKYFERYDLIDYPCSPFLLDPWVYIYETNPRFENVVVFRNRLTKADIDCPNIVTKAFLEQQGSGSRY